MNVRKIKDEEIKSIVDFMHEIAWLRKELAIKDMEKIDLPLNYKMREFVREEDDPNQFLYCVVKYLESLPVMMAITNLQTLLENCADPDSDTLEFNENIMKVFKLLKGERAGISTVSGFFLKGDLSQMSTQKAFLTNAGFVLKQIDVYPVVAWGDVKMVLASIYINKIEGWWNYRDDYPKYGIEVKD